MRDARGMVYSLGSPEVRDMQTFVIIPTYNERDTIGPAARVVLAIDPAPDKLTGGRRT